jgi:transposase
MKFRQLDKETREQIRKCVLLIRYRTTQPNAWSKKYVSIERVAKTLGVPYNLVQHLCRYYYKVTRATKDKRQVRRLNDTHLAFLLDRNTLIRWAGRTLGERAVLFELRFPQKRLAVTTLRRLYLAHGVKRKKVRQEKVMPLSAWENFEERRRDLIANLAQAREEGRKVIYLDEIVFSKRSFLGVDWSRANQNLHVDQQQVYQGYRATIAACSEERGIEHIQTANQAINGQDFIGYLRVLKRGNPGRIAVLMDQLPAHRSNEVRAACEELDILRVFNVAYSPEFNPIEGVFSQVKRTYCRERLHQLANDGVFDQTDQVRQAFRRITRDVVRGCVHKSMSALNDI